MSISLDVISRPHRAGAVLLLCFLCLVYTTNTSAQWIEHNDSAMTTEIHLAFWNPNENSPELIAASMEEFHRINNAYSSYDPNSLLSRVNLRAHRQSVAISSEFALLIERSILLSNMTEGAFDITFNSIGYRYDYRNQRKPSEQELASGLSAIDYRYLLLDATNQTIRFAREGVKICLGGIAKGYAVERVGMILTRAGIRSAQITAGGDSRFIGAHGDRPWSVGIQHPRREGELAAIIPASDEAVSTSGDYQRYFIEGGVRYHHIIDPQTGESANTVRSATVLGPDGMMTDGLSTGIFVLGVEAGLALINDTEGYEAVVIDARGLLYYSDGFDRQQ